MNNNRNTALQLLAFNVRFMTLIIPLILGLLGRFRTGPGKDEETKNLKSPVENADKKLEGDGEGVQLKREVGLFSAVFLVVGTMIGMHMLHCSQGLVGQSFC